MVDISINWTLFAQIFNFIILVLALNAFFFKPVRKTLAERRTFFQNLEQEGDTARLMIEEGEARRESHKAEMLVAGAEVLSKCKEEGRAKERELLDKAGHESGERIEAARASLASSLAPLRLQLSKDSEVLAKSMVEMVLGREAPPAGPAPGQDQ
jgi:F-type H+-transporting ATPase subunit b